MDKPMIDGPEQPYCELSDEARAESQWRIMASAPSGDGVWVFGFGSLMWNPCFSFTEHRPASITGYERKFHIWTTKARGTPDMPGLGLCLEKADRECRGVAYRLADDHLEDSLDALWCREMTTGIYEPAWCEIEFETGDAMQAITFVVNHTSRQYVGPMPMQQMAPIIARASGEYGTCRDYLSMTIAVMADLGVRDPELDELLRMVDALRA